MFRRLNSKHIQNNKGPDMIGALFIYAENAG